VISAGSAETVTTNASDAFGFVFDTNFDTDTFHLVGVAANTDATVQTLTTAPVADDYITLRVECTAAGVATFYINGAQVGILPAQGDSWKTISLPIAGPALDTLRSQGPASAVRITTERDRGDSYKVRGLRLILTLADGSEWAGDASGAVTTQGDWPHAEGRRFASPTDSGPIALGE
jgi:hypothetical protein